MKLARRTLWIAALMGVELLAFGYFLLHAPSGEGHAQDPLLRRQSSPNVRKCLSDRHRDPRFVRNGECVTPTQRMAALEDLLFELKTVFDTIAAPYWIDSGSLLGQYRTGGVIPWDVNGNVGMLSEGLEKLRTTNIALPDGYELEVLHSKYYPQGGRVDAIPARWIEKKYGFYIDIFEFLEFENADDPERKLLGTRPHQVWNTCEQCAMITVTSMPPRMTPIDGKEKGAQEGDVALELVEPIRMDIKRFLIPKDWIFPLKPCTFETFDVNCPAQIVRYLTHLYGDEFLEPDFW
uniref:LicD/FKTN/FKRP nucleotidyltransferase domain-containing protein n=1 Tax=Globisporangium ultimum (strain ATCC 200006 / CBS 805.95 / DAOM BR144) TaxID=431595 RepID=K3X2M3_GLOUD